MVKPTEPDFSDPGLLDSGQISLLTDQYQLAMASSYLRRDMNQLAVFEHFVRRLPPNRQWLLAAGLGPTLELIAAMRFDEPELDYLKTRGFEPEFLEYLSSFSFSGDIDALPEGTVFFANEPILRVTAPRIEAQLLETLVLNQINFQTMVATKAARVVLAAGGGKPDHGEAVIDFSPRRDHGTDAAMKVARSAAIAGCGGTSNVAAAMRYGLEPVGTMAHSYVLSFPSELEAFQAFMQDHPDNTVLLVDTFDSRDGVMNAIEASRTTGIPLKGIRLDSGDLLELSREARGLLDCAGQTQTRITASGDLNEEWIGELVDAGAPIDTWGVGTDLGTSRDSPVVNGVYKLVADRRADGSWRGVEKHSPEKETRPGAKQVYRCSERGQMVEDVIVDAAARVDGEPLLVPVMRGGRIMHRESLEQIRDRTRSQLEALPKYLRDARLANVNAYPTRFAKLSADGPTAPGSERAISKANS